MAVTLTRFSYWLWKTKESNNNTNLSPNNSSSDFPLGFREFDSLKFPSLNETKKNSSSSKRFRKKWQSREERKVRIEKEFDAIIVQSDEFCQSGSESDDSDWSIGWVEPHFDDFGSREGEIDDGFAVLVPCYGRGGCEMRMNVKKYGLDDVAPHCGFSSEDSNFIERWLSSLHDM